MFRCPKLVSFTALRVSRQPVSVPTWGSHQACELSNGGEMTRLMRLTLAVLACSFVLGSRPIAAQESRGSIAGLVVDSSGGALPGVTVTIRNIGTNATVVQTTNNAGQYTAVLLLPGTYNVTVELSGFQKRE